MSSKRQNATDKDDWRLLKFKQLNTGGKCDGIEVGCCRIQYEDEIMYFPTPDFTALFLNLSKKMHEKGQEFFMHKTKLQFNFHENPKQLFDAVECRTASIVFAYSALESFANQMIPSDFRYLDATHNKFLRIYDKNQIERWLNLDVKLKDILPQIISNSEYPCNNDNSLKGTSEWDKLWKEFLELKKARDEVVHLKTLFLSNHDDSEKDIWHLLLSIEFPEWYKYSLSIIGYFIKRSEKKLRWYEECPFK